MVVSPSARSPARMRQDFTCAEATLRWWAVPWRLPPRMAMGGRVLFLRPATVAPMALSGSRMRPMGLRLMLASPVSTQRKSREATSPGSRRMSVPELATSMTLSGSRRPSQPAPWTTRSVPSLLDLHPQRPHSRHRGQSVRRTEEALHAHRTVVHGAQQNRPMRDRLVAGHSDRSPQSLRHRLRRGPRRSAYSLPSPMRSTLEGIAQPVQKGRRHSPRLQTIDEQDEVATHAAAHVVQSEVLDVDAGVAQSGHDLGYGTRTVGHAHGDSIERLGSEVGELEHLLTVRGGRVDGSGNGGFIAIPSGSRRRPATRPRWR